MFKMCLEIKCQVVLEWKDWDRFTFLKTYISTHYDFDKRDVDDSKHILEDIAKSMCDPVVSDDEEMEADNPIYVLDDELLDGDQLAVDALGALLPNTSNEDARSL